MVHFLEPLWVDNFVLLPTGLLLVAIRGYLILMPTTVVPNLFGVMERAVVAMPLERPLNGRFAMFMLGVNECPLIIAWTVVA